MTDLSENEYAAVNVLPATTTEISEALDVTRSYVYDLIVSARQKGVDIQQDMDGRYYLPDEEATDNPNFTTLTRQLASEKAAITNEAKAILAELEYGLKQTLENTEPPRADRDTVTEGTQDLIIHRTDDHFGEVVRNQHGEEVFNSDIAEDRVWAAFEQAMAKAESLEDRGVTFEGAHLLHGGDLVTNDVIYEGQKNDTDESVQEQVERASNVYLEQIKELSDRFPYVQVACQVGNHGRLQGASINADGIVYSMMDHMIRENNDIDNVEFIRSDKSYYIDFDIRDYDVHLRHGHDSSLEHIGTNSAKARWRSWLIDHGFDIAFRGHYHQYKAESINGRPVYMGGSIVPQTDFEESHALSGRPVSAIHGAGDIAPDEWTERIYYH